MEQVDTIKAERDTLEKDLKVQQDDMAVKFLSALAADGTIPDVEAIITSNLSSGFDSLKRSVTDSMASQEKTMAAVQTANDKFVKEKQSGRAVTERETMLKDLATAYDIYMELLGNLQEGTKFYNDFTPILVRYQQKVNDLVFARKTEREELSRDLQKSIANQPPEQTPQAPPHHQALGGRATAPPRPAPPSTQQPPAAAIGPTPTGQALPTAAPSGPPPQYPASSYQPLPQPGYVPYGYGGYYPPGGNSAGYPGYTPPLAPGYYYPGGYGMPPPQGYPPQGQQPPSQGQYPSR